MWVEVDASLELWKKLDLPNLQRDLDTQSQAILDGQKETVQARKMLAEQTKEFRKASDEEKLIQFKTLYKAYQNEIDNLTKRLKRAEASFLDVYQVVADLTDPSPILNLAKEQAEKLVELDQLKSDNERMEADMMELRNELERRRMEDASIRKMKRRLEEYEQDMEEIIADQVAEKEIEIRAEMDENVRQIREREGELERQLHQTQEQLRQLKSSHDHSQAKLLDKNHKFDEQLGAKLAEMELMSRDLERANARILEQSNEMKLLQNELENVKKADIAQEQLKIYQQKSQEQETEIANLVQEMMLLKQKESEKRNEAKELIDELEAKLGQKEVIIKEMSNEISKKEDYDLIRKELEILKSLEFSKNEGDQEKVNGKQSLERLLMGKNRRLQDEVTELKHSKAEQKTLLQKLEKELEETKVRVEKQRELILKLEEDLAKTNPHEHPANTSQPQSAWNQQSLEPPASPRPSSPASLSSSTLSHQEPATILPIIKSQRDRFRQRNIELEEELRKQRETELNLIRQLDQLREDNLKLFEKIRYMQTYGDAPAPAPVNMHRRNSSAGWTAVTMDPSTLAPASTSSALSSNNHHQTTARSSGHRQRQSSSVSLVDVQTAFPEHFSQEVTDKYRQLYEGNMNPFQRFTKREQFRTYRSLNPLDKALLFMLQLMMANSVWRMLFVGYVFMLHMLVIICIYQTMGITS